MGDTWTKRVVDPFKKKDQQFLSFVYYFKLLLIYRNDVRDWKKLRSPPVTKRIGGIHFKVCHIY